MDGIRGSRGKKKPRETHNISTSVLAIEAGKYYECFDVVEDRSLTKQQHLRFFNQSLLRRGKPIADKLTLMRETSKTHKRVLEIEE